MLRIATLVVASAALGLGLGFAGTKTLATTDATRLARHEIRDPGMNNMVSHTLLVPEGWKVEGGVAWTPGMKPFVHPQFGVSAGDGREIWFLSGVMSSYAEIPPALMQQMRMQGQVIPQPGTPQGDGTIWQPPPRDASDYIVRQLLPQGRPNAREPRVLETERLREFEEMLQQVLAPMFEAQRQSAMNAMQMGIQTDQSLTVSRISVGYQEGGQAFREDFIVMLMLGRTVIPDVSGFQGGPIVQHHWFGVPVVAARAPAERYTATEPLFITIAGSLSSTPEWQTRVDELQAEISRIEHQGRMASIEEFGRRQRQIAETNREISEMQMSSWRERQDSNSRMSRSFSNAMLGVDDYRNPDGSSVSLPSDYNRVFTDAQGNYMMSNDPHFDPNRLDQRGGWQQMQRAR